MTSQNLVQNPSFEDFVECPKTFGSLDDDVLFWKQPTDGSTDYFNSCSTHMPASQNFIGQQAPFEGNAYVGFYAYGPKGYREYIAGELTEKLVKGKKYNFSMRVSLADASEYAIDEFGILFTSKMLNLHTKRNIRYNKSNRNRHRNYISVKKLKYYCDKENWSEVSGEYIANGTEKYMVIGNFKADIDTHIIKVASSTKKVAYYYLDKVSVEKAEDTFKLDEVYVFENIFFEVDRHEVKAKGKKQLESLIMHLRANTSLNISIYGHTDNVGSSLYNKELSRKRAKAVGRFLVNNGLSPSRIAWKGFGDVSPVAKNETTEGRKKNRRVEFVISKKQEEPYASGSFDDGTW